MNLEAPYCDACGCNFARVPARRTGSYLEKVLSVAIFLSVALTLYVIFLTKFQ